MRRLAVVAAFAVVAIPLGVQGEPQDPTAQDPTARWPRRGEYVGAAACKECHEDEAARIEHGVHASVAASPHTMQCETCHGPGDAHAKDSEGPPEKITHPQLLEPKVQAALCGRCHASEARDHGGGGMAGFLAAGLGCTECHEVHQRRAQKPLPDVRFRSRQASLAAATAVATSDCAKCHPLQHASLRESAHRELAADEPHGGCTTCHGNGSMHVEHEGVARFITRPDRATDGVPGCVACHNDVDPVRAHWRETDAAFLTQGLDCFACHRIHDVAKTGTARNADCAGCHARAFVEHVAPDSVHASLVEAAAPLASGCGACHAGAAEHARAGGGKALVESLRSAPRAVVERTCKQCHGDEPALHGVASGAHARADVSCTACHSPSAPRGAVRADAERNCAQCHGDVAARFALPSHHRVGPDEQMGCSDCHEPHSARPRLRDHDLREGRCVGCHVAYRGPFVWAHQASRLDGCVACHEPHGSPNRRMLREATSQQNCVACHGDFPAFHDQTQGSVFTRCLECHTQVHGSNHSRFFFR
ncbi:MAG: cytochrome c3 family protein [Planctomycetes bacterium]|nr:cytochrome c3 family protein [Planctomycetota bacterium]